MQVRGATFELSGREASLAEKYEQEEPRDAPASDQCTYWKQRVHDAQGGHVIGIVSWPAEYFATLRRWAEAKQAAACTQPTKKAAPTTVAGACGPLANPERRYLLDNTVAVPRNRGAADVLDPRSLLNAGEFRALLPRNAAVDVTRFLRSTVGSDPKSCPFAEVMVVDGELGIEPGELWAVPRDALGGTSLDATRQAEVDEKRARAAAEAEKIRVAARTEIDSGRCSDANHAKLDKELGNWKYYYERTRNDGWLLVSHQFVMASDKGDRLGVNAGTSGTYRVLAEGVEAVHLEVRDAKGYASSKGSTTPEHAVETRDVEANHGERFDITVKGTGCAIVIVFAKL